VTDLTAEVMAALERSVLPSVIARGAAVRVAAAADGIVTLEVTGSPGAVFPLASRIETLIRAAVPGITAVRLVTPGAVSAGSPPDVGGSLAEAARRVLDAVAGADRGWIRIRLEGGCQGCSLAEVTVRQGIEPLLRARLPAMTGLVDVTDHEAGTEPFFSAEKR
jgi:Fe-S cluster biogenesis protein NfuA